MLDQISDRTASMLCYIPVFGILPSIVFLAAQKYRRNLQVRFDAFQSLYLFVAFLVVSSVLPPFFWLSGDHDIVGRMFVEFLKAGVFLCWIFLLVKAAQQHAVRLPLIGDLAARSAQEQM